MDNLSPLVNIYGPLVCPFSWQKSSMLKMNTVAIICKAFKIGAINYCILVITYTKRADLLGHGFPLRIVIHYCAW